MGEAQLLLHQPPPPPPPQRRSRLGGLRGGGQIVEVHGGHIVRSIGRKDRHSKVCTAKGPRDRRVRLSAHTAIQFYDVQDRLGYDRPSKAVDWLIQNAKAAIDELAELPPWYPTTIPSASCRPRSSDQHEERDSGKRPKPVAEPVGNSASGGSSSFLPPSLDSDAIADTIRSFFPGASTPSSSPPLGYHQNYPQSLLSRTSSQDLRLSLQSLQDPIFQQHQSSAAPAHHAIFSSSAPLAFDVNWPEQSHRLFQWNVGESSGGGGGAASAAGGGGGGGYIYNALPPPSPTPEALPLHSVLGQGHFFTQRGPLQSSNSPSVRTRIAEPMLASADLQMHHALNPLISSMGFASGSGSFSGFRIPARIQGEEEHDDGISEKPSAAPSPPHQ